MMNCAICREGFIHGDRLVANSMETFLFKPASVDEKTYKLSEDAMVRQGYKKTEMATQFITFDETRPPEDVFNVRHALCSVQRTGTVLNGVHPIAKHAIRYQRSILRRSHGFAA